MMTDAHESKAAHELSRVIDDAESEFINKTIRKIAEKNCFGRGKLVDITGRDNSNSVGKHFMSKVEFKTIIFEEEDDATRKEIPVVIKIQVGGHPKVGGIDDMASNMFNNEIVMFNDVLPLLGTEELELFPRHYYCAAGNLAGKDIVITEDLTKQQFTLLEQTITRKDRMSFLVRKLGQFHGSCYRLKKRNPSAIINFKTSLKPTKHFYQHEDFRPLHKCMSVKIAEHLVRESPVLERLVKNLRSNRDILVDIRTPEEPFAAVVHGDLFSSNIFVRGSEAINDVRFIDLQTCFYSDPTFDLSFMLFMCGSMDLVEQHWDDFVVDYWHGITSVEDRPGFNFDDLRKNIEKKALSGFVDASFFIPLMMTPSEKHSMGNPKMSHDEISEMFFKNAPPEAFDKLVSILKFALVKGFITKSLDCFDE